MLAAAFTYLFSYFLLIAAIPTTDIPLLIPPSNPQNIICQLPILKKFLCPPTGTAALTRSTLLGTANGVLDPSGAYRFSVRYAVASRWAPSSVATTWTLPNGSTNVSSLPLPCPQNGVDSSLYSEDCLSMVIYVPPSLSFVSAAPTLAWIHGGSFIVGSATGPGLDGSNLAIATNSIVAVLQYRLGALGFMAPNGQTNLAVKDIINALKFLEKVVPSFGGSCSKISLAGQSSGANMIRALLAVPSATSLFTSAILQSDPMDFGFLSTITQSALQANYTAQINCRSTDTSCLNSLSVSTILNAQTQLFNAAINIDPAAGRNEPIRPVLDGSLITSPLDSTKPFPIVTKSILISTVANEAGFAIYSGFPVPLAEAAFEPVVGATFDANRTSIILSSSFYPPMPSTDGSVDARTQLQVLGTDYLWKCAGWTFARNWVANGGVAYVGQYVVGATYPGNEQVPYCTQAGVVCHQDDIQIVFGTVVNATASQSALTTEIQARYKAFLATGNPNVGGYTIWPPATTSSIPSILLGGSGLATDAACVPSFWGLACKYDYQHFNG